MIEHHQPPLISVIVPCYQQSEELPDCLRALLAQRFEQSYEIILVDSASDPYVKCIAGDFPSVRLIRSAERRLCGSAKNLGAQHARAKYLAFTDSDCIPESDWLQHAHDTLHSGKPAVGGPVLDALPGNPIAVTDNLLQFAEVPPGRPAGRIAHIPGCNFGISREAFLKAGRFSEHPFGDDVSLTGSINRVYPEGIHFNPGMRVAHSGRSTFISMWNHQKLFGYWRGKLGLFLTDSQQRLGQNIIALPFVVVKRLVFIFNCIVRWNNASLVRNILLIPLILAGLISWSLGFRQGCIHSVSNPVEKSYGE